MNYRTFYKRHYKIDFSNYYQIHHIDFDRDNNDISNLLLLPRDIHRQYHNAVKALSRLKGYPLTGTINLRPVGWLLADVDYERECIKRFWEAMDACRKWVDYKMYLDGKLPNVHGICLLTDEDWEERRRDYV